MEAHQVTTTAPGKAAPATMTPSHAYAQALVLVLMEGADPLRPTGGVRAAQLGDVLAVVGGRVWHAIAPVVGNVVALGRCRLGGGGRRLEAARALALDACTTMDAAGFRVHGDRVHAAASRSVAVRIVTACCVRSATSRRPPMTAPLK